MCRNWLSYLICYINYLPYSYITEYSIKATEITPHWDKTLFPFCSSSVLPGWAMVASFIRFQCKQTTHCLSELQTSRTHNEENTRKIWALVKELRFRTDIENIFLRSKVWAPINQPKGEMLLVWCPPFQMGSTQPFLLLLLPLTNLFQYIQTSDGPLIMTHNICRR